MLPLHGAYSTHHEIRGLLRGLLPGHRVLYPDLPGHGASTGVSAASARDGSADALPAELRAEFDGYLAVRTAATVAAFKEHVVPTLGRYDADPEVRPLTVLVRPRLPAQPTFTMSGVSTSAPAPSPSPDSITIGALTVASLPRDLGSTSGPAEYFYDDQGSFHQAAWESGNDNDGWTTDLRISAIARDDLTDAQALFDWYVPYEERPAEDVDYSPTKVGDADGFVTRDQIFWLIRPGLACSMTIDLGRFTAEQLRTCAESVTTAESAADPQSETATATDVDSSES